ncbi:MAG: hypothetical protein IKZ53_01980 [Selenomonadaceae bacterium]|nr:hypothetical protein [Selenomonadaceae bacterium]
MIISFNGKGKLIVGVAFAMKHGDKINPHNDSIIEGIKSRIFKKKLTTENPDAN